MPALSYINLEHNPSLTSIQALNGHPFLRHVLARYCSIEQLPRYLSKLLDFYMSHNNLSNLIGIHTVGDPKKNKRFYFDSNAIKSENQ